MELELFSKLYDRIQLEASILLLGQNYFSLGGGKDPVWQKISTEIYPELNLPRCKADYPSLWQQTVKNVTDAEKVMQQVAETGKGMWKNSAVTAITKLRWSLMYTSAIDSTESMVTTKGYSPVPQEEKNARSQYLNKDRRYRVNLCGSCECVPPPLINKIDQKTFDRQISNKIAWISNTYLEYYGILVIDGLDLEHDWLNDDNLFAQLFGLPSKSVYWFSAPEQLGENALLLVEQGILTTDTDGFYEHMLHYMPELLEDDDSAYIENDDTLCTSLTLRFGNRQTRTVRISRSDITDITGDILCVIDDDILRGDIFNEKNRPRRFADFLTQSRLPSWYLFNTKSDEEPFYISRDADQALECKVYDALKETSVARKPIILCGPSNSGKSMMLAKLALNIAERRKYPVIFIRGDMVPGAEKRLENFINNWFCNAERYDGERPDKIIVIWDGGGLTRTERDYENLQSLLFNRNAQVVGSVYSSMSKNAVNLEQALSSQEEKSLYRVLRSLGDNYAEHFREIQRARDSSKILKNSSLLYLLQTLFKYEFDSEYRSLAEVLATQFKQEKEYAERETSLNLEKYVEDFFEAHKVRTQAGVAASFQEKLRLILTQMTVQEQEKLESEESRMSNQNIKIEKFKQLSKCISKINEILSVASEFGIQVPLRLILRFLRDKSSNSYVMYGEESIQIIKILNADTLINCDYKSHPRFGEDYYIGFRNSIEAENYICLLCNLPLEDHSDKRKEKEIEILKQIIQAAESEAELWSVVELVRQFGPNGHGLLSEQEKMRTKSDYLEYKTYWFDLAKEIIEQFPDDPEVVLLYAHLTREFIFHEESCHKAYYMETYTQARTRLEGALRRMEDGRRDNTLQYDRLSVELCANYQQSLREKFDIVIYQSIKDRIRSTFRRSKRENAVNLSRDFSSNCMLDILLNAYSEYRKHILETKSSADDEELANIVCDIDDMLNLDDIIYEKKSQDIINKIREIYSLLGAESSYISKLEQKLINMNSDAFLYLGARMIWQKEATFSDELSCDQNSAFFCEDRYFVIFRDIPYFNVNIADEVLEQTRNDARNVVEFLKNNEDTIRKTKSERCIAMLLRAKWFLKTGNPMLAEKQCVSLTRSEWDEIRNLCSCYHSFHDVATHEAFVPAYFLMGVYEWIFGDARRAIDWFNGAKDNGRNDAQTKSVERLVLCAEGTDVPRTFKICVKQNENRKHTASIICETTQVSVGKDYVITRYGMGASDAVVKYLFDGTMPREKNQQAKKEGVVRFNLIGAQIGIPQIGGKNNGQ